MAQEDQNGSADVEVRSVKFLSAKPRIILSDAKAADAISFYKKAFGADELKRAIYPKRKGEEEALLYAELQISSLVLAISDQIDASLPGSGFTFSLEADDVEAAVNQAVAAGASLETEISEEEFSASGEDGVSGRLKDPYGNNWIISSQTKSKCAKVDV